MVRYADKGLPHLNRRPGGLALVLAGGAIFSLNAGCKPPREPMFQVTATAAPLLPEPEDDARPQAVLRAGELLRLDQPFRPLHWRGSVDNQPMERDGMLVRVARSATETLTFAWQQDLGPSVEVPTAAWICAQAKAAPECAARLRRFRLDERTTVAYEPCFGPACSIMVVTGRTVEHVRLDGLTDLRVATVNGQTAGLGTTRWFKPPNLSGGSTFVYRLTPRFERAMEIKTEEVEVRPTGTRIRNGDLTVAADGMVFDGQERETSTTGEVTSTHPLREYYKLAPAVRR